MRTKIIRVLVCLVVLICAAGAAAQSVDCANPTNVIPDGRLNGSSIPAGTVFWFALSTSQPLASYAVEADFPKGAAAMPTLGVFKSTDITPGPCTGSSSVTTRDIKALTPEAPNGQRLSFELVVYDKDGQPQTVQYHVLPALLLNELQRQQSEVAELRALVAAQAAELAELKAALRGQVERAGIR